MSERELREAADRYREQAHDIFGEEAVVALTEIYDDFGKALAADPDVVAVLRWLRDGAERIPNNTPVDRSWTSAARAIGVHIERTFHVCLTADGWEWTE